MPNNIEFKVVAIVNYGLPPLPFVAQFGPPLIPVPSGVNLPDPSQPAGLAALVAAALDAGNGSNLGPPMPTQTPADLAALQQFLQRRLDLTLSLFQQTASGDWIAQPFAKILDANTRTAESFALGMLYARVATGEWATANGWGAIQHFWHFGVLKHNAVTFNATKLLDALNPDFLVCHGNGNWASVEAKGKWGAYSHAELKRGMSQAGKWQLISWPDPATGVLIPPISVDSVCTMTYFDPTLQVLHLDPPGNAEGLAAPDRAYPVFLLEAAKFLSWIQAGLQLRALRGGGADDSGAAPLDEELVWAPWPGRPEVQIGGPQALLSASHALATGIEVLSWLVPRLGRWRRSALRQPEREAERVRPRLRRLVSEARQLAISEERTQGVWLRLSQLLQKLGHEKRADLKWTDVLVVVWAADLLGDFGPAHRPFSSLLQLHDWMNNTLRASRERWQLDVESPAAGSPPTPYFVHTTSHGLLVVARGDASFVTSQGGSQGRNTSRRGSAIP